LLRLLFGASSFLACVLIFGAQKQKARLTACAVGGLEIRL
jgi:hypothetical protein